MPSAIAGSSGSPTLSQSEFEPRELTAEEYKDNFNTMKSQPGSMKVAAAFVPEGAAAYISHAWLGEKTEQLPLRVQAMVHRLVTEFEGTTKIAQEIDLSDFTINTQDDWFGVGKFYLPRASDADECLIRYGCNTSDEPGVVRVTAIAIFQHGSLVGSLTDKNVTGFESAPER